MMNYLSKLIKATLPPLFLIIAINQIIFFIGKCKKNIIDRNLLVLPIIIIIITTDKN